MMNYIEEELTLSEFAKKFMKFSDFSAPDVIDIKDLNIEILSKNLDTNLDEYKLIEKFVIKNSVDSFYTDGALKGTSNHRIIDDVGNDVVLKNHTDFKKIDAFMNVVDIEVADNHNYYANGRLNHNTTSGGKALGFHASVRLRLTSMGKIKKPDEDPIGTKVKAQVTKNRVGPPYRTAEFDMYFDSGIDVYSGWITTLKNKKLISQSGSTYSFEMPNGEKVSFMAKEFVKLMEEHPEYKAHLYDKLCDALIMKYKSGEESKLGEDLSIDTDMAGVE